MDQQPRIFSLALLVATLGYFVDVYDLVLFIVLKNPSLADLGVPPEQRLEVGVALLDTQMIGMLVGGVVWGVLGDKLGRTKALFGSILLYSVANILNGFVHSIPSYHFYRALAGFGLAGELGAGVTLVAEILPTALRGYGTTIIASIGVLGAVVAGLTGEFLDWRHSYIVGGALGLALLLVRVSVAESRMFEETHAMDVKRGSLRLLLASKDRLFRYTLCILLGVPTWYVIGILVANVQPLATALQATEAPKQTYCLVWAYLGIMLGDVVGGLVSQRMQSRKKPMYAFLLLGLAATIFFLSVQGLSLTGLYLCYLVLGFAAGYWILMLTTAAEQFGTNIRSTVTVTIPNFIRASVVPMNMAFLWFEDRHGIIWSAMVVGVVTSVVSLISLILLKETFHRDLDFVER